MTNEQIMAQEGTDVLVAKDLTNYIVVTMDNGMKYVPLHQAEAMRRERDALLIAYKNTKAMLSMYQRCANVDNGAE